MQRFCPEPNSYYTWLTPLYHHVSNNTCYWKSSTMCLIPILWKGWSLSLDERQKAPANPSLCYPAVDRSTFVLQAVYCLQLTWAACLWTVGRNWSTWRKYAQTRGQICEPLCYKGTVVLNPVASPVKSRLMLIFYSSSSAEHTESLCLCTNYGIC